MKDCPEYCRTVPHQGFCGPTVVILLTLMLVGCSSTSPGASGWGGRLEDHNTRTDDNTVPPAASEGSRIYSKSDLTEIPESPSAAREQLLNILSMELDNWIGTPHVWGGSTLSGVDCSGLIHSVYGDALNVRLPRTTSEMEKAGKSIRRSELKTGDLVFFRPDGSGRHVGIYMENSEFIHSSSSRGVMSSSLNEAYWNRYYHKARRVFTSNDHLIKSLLYAQRMSVIRSDLQRERDQIVSPSG